MHAESGQPFILTTDWSKVAVGAVLSQMQPRAHSDLGSSEKEFLDTYILQTGTEPGSESLCSHGKENAWPKYGPPGFPESIYKDILIEKSSQLRSRVHEFWRSTEVALKWLRGFEVASWLERGSDGPCISKNSAIMSNPSLVSINEHDNILVLTIRQAMAPS